jgi:hypothetical protein
MPTRGRLTEQRVFGVDDERHDSGVTLKEIPLSE